MSGPISERQRYILAWVASTSTGGISKINRVPSSIPGYGKDPGGCGMVDARGLVRRGYLMENEYSLLYITEAGRNALARCPAPCPACGRPVARWTNSDKIPPHGKRRVRHKCPHGKWCRQGDPLWGPHSNGRQLGCKPCLDYYQRMVEEPSRTA